VGFRRVSDNPFRLRKASHFALAVSKPAILFHRIEARLSRTLSGPGIAGGSI
jgi:hypothetical protein